MYKLIVGLLFFISLPLVAAENTIINTELDINIRPLNHTCYVSISTEGDDINYNVSTDTTYADEEIEFIRDLKCEEELYYENMSRICTSLSGQYSTLINNLNYIPKYEECNTKVVTEGFYKNLYTNQSTTLTSCNAEKESRLTREYCNNEIQLQKADMVTNSECQRREGVASNKFHPMQGLLAFFAGCGAYHLYLGWKKRQNSLNEGMNKPRAINKIPEGFSRRRI